jgi:signal recognition particle subunit SRP54
MMRQMRKGGGIPGLGGGAGGRPGAGMGGFPGLGGGKKSRGKAVAPARKGKA